MPLTLPCQPCLASQKWSERAISSGLGFFFGVVFCTVRMGFGGFGQTLDRAGRGLGVGKPGREFVLDGEQHGGMHQEGGFDGQALDRPSVVRHAGDVMARSSPAHLDGECPGGHSLSDRRVHQTRDRACSLFKMHRLKTSDTVLGFTVLTK